MKPRSAQVLPVLLAIMLPAPACSYLFVTPPREQYGARHGNCTSNLAAPAVDFVFGSTNGLSTIYVATQGDNRYRYQAIGVGAGAAVLWLSSAVYGVYNTQRCAELLEDDELGRYSRPAPVQAPVPLLPRGRPATVTSPSGEPSPGPVPPTPPVRQQLDSE